MLYFVPIFEQRTNQVVESQSTWKIFQRKKRTIGWIKRRGITAISLLRKRYGIFVGRLKLKEDIGQSLVHSRLVSLVGTAGVGKTHLALQTSTQWRNNGEREVLFCDLTVAFDTTSVAQILGKVLDITLVPSDPWSQIEEEIQQRAETILLVLDNVDPNCISNLPNHYRDSSSYKQCENHGYKSN